MHKFIALNGLQDADQLLEKRVRSRFSHRKLLFLPPSEPEVQRSNKFTFPAQLILISEQFFSSLLYYLIYCLCRLMNHVLSLPMDSSILLDYATDFNTKLQVTSQNMMFIKHAYWYRPAGARYDFIF